MTHRTSLCTFFLLAFFSFTGFGCAQEDSVYFGSLHSHTSYSDGSGTPEEAYTYARDVGHLDFLAITEHNHLLCEQGADTDRRDGIMIAKDHSLYNGTQASSLLSAAKRLTLDGKFVALYGQEFSTISSGNHANVFEVPEVIDVASGRFDLLLEWIAQHPDSTGKSAIIQFNHPDTGLRQSSLEYGADDFGDRATWIKKMGERAATIEILNGPGTNNANDLKPESFESHYFYYLSQGFHLAPSGDQDNHYRTWGTLSSARTGVVAKSLTKANILDAIRQRHVYATKDKNLRIIFKVNGHLCGDRIPPPAPNSDLSIQYSIIDDDEPNAHYTIEPFIGEIGKPPVTAPVDKFPTDGNTAPGTFRTIDELKYSGGPQYIFFRIRQDNEEGSPDLAWTAPVWFDGAQEPVPIAVEDVTAYLASVNSGIYHVSLDCRDAKRIKAANIVRGADAVKGRQKHEGCPLQ